MAAVDGVEALADMPPGPRLAAALAEIDPGQVPNNNLLRLLAAQSRQAAYEAARQLRVIAEINRANPTFDDDAVDRLTHPHLHTADEVHAALAWSRRAAERECDLAEQVVHDLPAVHAAFLDIDRSKVRVFAEHLAGLTPEQIARICARLVPQAAGLTPGELGARLRRMIVAIDPRHYNRRYRKALRDRRVCAWLDDNGTAVLSTHGLTPAQAQAALERIDLLAHAARRAGHRSNLDQIRVDLVGGLLDGTLHHLTRDQIIAHLIAHRSGNDDGTESGAATGTENTADHDAPVDNGGSGSCADTAGQNGSEDAAAGEDGEDTAAGEDTAVAEEHRVGVEVRVALTTVTI